MYYYIIKHNLLNKYNIDMEISLKIEKLNIEQINNIVKNHLGLKLKNTWRGINKVNDHDWLIYSETQGIMTDFVWKHFDNYIDCVEKNSTKTANITWIIQYALKINNKRDVFNWLEEKGFIEKNNLNKEKCEFLKKFYGAKNNNNIKLIEYLKSRSINFEYVKDFVSFYDNLNNLLILWRDLKTWKVVNLHKRNILKKEIYKESNWSNNYVFYNSFEKNKDIIAVEWEIDWLTLLQFEELEKNYNIIWVPWINSFDYLFLNTEEYNVFLIPDNDKTENGILWKVEKFNNIQIINNFLKISKEKDVNDYQVKNLDIWKKIIDEINIKKLEKIDYKKEIIEEKEDRYVFIKSLARYYWLKKDVFHKAEDVCSCLLKSREQLKEMRLNWEIKTYDDMVYKYWGEKNSFNIMDEDSIIKANNTPILHPYIKLLIENVCWYNKINIEWIYKAILYKYKNINSYNIPWVILYWVWWSWKWTFIKLLSKIFWERNTLENLSYDDLVNSFDVYEWNKLIVEYWEIWTYNVWKDKRVLNKLKWKICQEKVTVNKKWISQFQRDNLAWFFITSNENKPIQLDSKEKGNRRFTVIKSKKALTYNESKAIYDTIRNKNVISSFIAWLEKEFWKEVNDLDFEIKALDNQEKIDLENRALSDIDNFWLEIKDKYPIWTKIKIFDIKTELIDFANKIEENISELERFLWNNSPFVKTKISIDGKKYWWIKIE